MLFSFFPCSKLVLVLVGQGEESVSMGGPLSGVRVLDFSSAVTGPFCTMLMGNLFGLGQGHIAALL